MGKKPGASYEELEFIFRCFLRGLPTKEVLDELDDTEFPKRNPRFIREKRMNFDLARRVLEEQPGGDRKSTPPITVQPVIHLMPKRKMA